MTSVALPTVAVLQIGLAHTLPLLGLKALKMLLIMFSPWLVWARQPIVLSAGCAVARGDMLPREVKLPKWNLSLVLKSLPCLLYEPVKFSSGKHLTWKMFLIGFHLSVPSELCYLW